MIPNSSNTGDWSALKGLPYIPIKNELWSYGNLVMCNNRIIIPESLGRQMLTLAHEGHQGVVRTTSRLRSKVWWPGIDKEIEAFIRACHPCHLVGHRPQPEPLVSTVLPDGPWVELAVDLLDVPHGNHLFVIVDYYSCWPEVINLKNTDAGCICVIKVMESVFRTHGLPLAVRSDNGPPFTSREFEGFLEYLGIEHKK
jgi:hypothetical protein